MQSLACSYRPATTYDFLNEKLVDEKQGKVLSPLLETVYEELASEAFASFRDSHAVDEEFRRLICEMDREESAEKGTRPEERKSDAGRGQLPEDRQEQQQSSTISSNRRKSLDLIRRPVKDRRRLFELPAHEVSNGQAKRLKRTNSVREKQLFWEMRSDAGELANGKFQPHHRTQAKVDISSGLAEKRKFWESIVGQDADEQEVHVVGGTREELVLSHELATDRIPTALPSPGQSIPGSAHNSHPECDQDRDELDAIYGCEAGEECGTREVVTPATTGYDNISLAELSCWMPQHDSQPVAAQTALVGCSTSGSHDDGGGFIYDEFDEYSSYVGDYGDGSRNGTRHDFAAGHSFQLNARLGKMLGVNAEKANAFGAGLFSGLVDVVNVFTVTTADAGPGFLQIGIQGPAPGTTRMISQKALDESKFEVGYVVSCPGYYVIFVRWGDCYIYDSPFVCHISDPAAIM